MNRLHPNPPQVEQLLRDAQKSSGVRLLSHSVVYHLMDAIRGEMERAAAAAAAGGGAAGGGAAEVLAEVGDAEVLATFALSATKLVKDGRIAGEHERVAMGFAGRGGCWKGSRGSQLRVQTAA